MDELLVRRSALRMWLLALAGVPMIVLGVDILFRRRLVSALISLIFNPNELQAIEPRDVVWAIVLLVLGLIVIVFGLKELIAPRPVVRANREGLHLQLGHSFSKPVRLSWDEVIDIGSAEVDDSGDRIWVMWVRLRNSEGLPRNPWGARWIDSNTLAILASDWETHPRRVAELASEVAINVARTIAGPQSSEGTPLPVEVEPVWQWEKQK